MLNIQDNEGHTPLHLAIKNVNEAQTIRAVRFLMIRGTDTSIRNYNH